MHRLALIADTHIRNGKPVLPDRCIEALTAADLIVHAGDLVTPEALAALVALGTPVVAVRGNVDVPGLELVLPETHILTLHGACIAVVHDAGPARGRLDRLRNRFPGSDAVVFGHSHVPEHATADDGFQIFNPGSPTARRREPRHTMGLAFIADGTVTFELVTLD